MIPSALDGNALIQYLDTAGDGSGTINANTDISGAADDYYIQAPVGRKYTIHRLSVVGADAAGPTSGGYLGAAALTNGITLEKQSSASATLIDFTPAPIKTLVQWGLMGEGSDLQLGKEFRFRINFVEMFGSPVVLYGGEKLVATLHDDFTAQTDLFHYFWVTGLNQSDV